MSLEALLAKLEAKAVTPVTDMPKPDLTPKAAQTQGCTSVTPVTAKNITATTAHLLPASDWLDFYEQRAAIYEYEAGLPRIEAERLAYQDVALEYLQAKHPALLQELRSTIHQSTIH